MIYILLFFDGLFGDLGIFGHRSGGDERSSAVFVELAEEFDVLQTRVVNEGAEQVDYKVNDVPQRDYQQNISHPTTVFPPIVPKRFTTCAITAEASPSAIILE